MPSRYEQFDRGRLEIQPLAAREHDVTIADLLDVSGDAGRFEHPDLPAVADAVAAAVGRGAPVLWMTGAHVIKQGLSRYVIDAVRRGWAAGIAGNGACAIHDYELARIGATSESVARYIREGRFGLWRETGELNDVVRAGDAEGLGFGEAVGRAVSAGDEECFPHADASIFAAAWEAGVPATVHVGVGYDIVHEHPNADGAAIGSASYRDFLIFARLVERLEGGVLLCFGSAVMAPEVLLKALAMARNVAARQGRRIADFTTAVFDLLELSGDLDREASKDSPEYYYRPYKTLLVRTVRDGGRSIYVRGDHRATIPALHALLRERLS